MASLNLLTKDGRPKERVLVTGATGFVASHCVEQLLRGDFIVRGSVRDLRDAVRVVPIKELATGPNDRLELVEADLLLKDSWDQAVSGCDYVIHVASPVPAYEPKHASDIITTALDGTLAVLEACRRSGHVKKVILTGSALNVYDALVAATDGFDCSNVVHAEDEWTELNDGVKHNVFVQSKARAEKAAWNFMETLEGANSADVAAAKAKAEHAGGSTGSSPVIGSDDVAAFRPHSTSVNRLLMKQGRHKASISRHPCSFALTTLLPAFIVGPCVHGGNPLAAQLIYRMLLGGAEMPVIPDISIEICDVRDVARAHVTALKCHASDGHRILLCSKSIWLKDVGLALSKEFATLGYRVPTRPAPRWFGRVYAFIRRDLAWMRRTPHCITYYSNDKMQHLLGITPTPTDKSLVDMAHSLIMRGSIRMTTLYRQWLSRTELAAMKIEKKEAFRKIAQRLKKNGVELDDKMSPASAARYAKASLGEGADGCSSVSSSTSSLGLLMNSHPSGDTFSIDSDTLPAETNNEGGTLTQQASLHGVEFVSRTPSVPDAAVAEQEYAEVSGQVNGRRENVCMPPKLVAAPEHAEAAENVLKAAADDDEDAEIENRKGRMMSRSNIESESDEYEDAAEEAMLAAEDGEKYKY